MPTLDLPETEQQAVIAELAAHLEDLYNEQIQNGGTESEARKKVMNEVAQWRPLARKIQHAKSKEKTMNPRTRQLWLPSLVSLTTAMLSLMAMTTLGKPYLFYSHHVITTVYFPWLASLPLCGAAAAYLSARAGGARRARLASTLCPAVALLAVFCFIFMAGIVGADHALTFNGFLLFVWNWVFLPGTSLLLGALPFLSEQKPSPTF
jgi:hypothetical protein